MCASIPLSRARQAPHAGLLSGAALAVACALALALAACAGNAPGEADTATMPENASGGPALNQDQAIGLAGWALENPANTGGRPGRAARAIAAEDWLAGQTILYGNFGTYSPAGEPAWAELRAQARAAIGVARGARSQDVVDRLLAASDALAAGHTEAAKAELGPPVFTLGPDATLHALARLPELPASGWAFDDLRRFSQYSGGHSR